ncbi:MAG: DUF6537 domain-containing protein, partial [Methyloligellaceae bacterium]
VEAIRARESERIPGATDLTDAVARGYFKLLADKDEYEVARLYTDGTFRRQLDGLFKGDYALEFHLAPPILAKTDPLTGRPHKRQFGPWMMRAFRVLAGLRGLRGTPFDIFGRTAERRMERRLIADYETVLDEIAERLAPETHGTAIELARLPATIRGFGHVKQASVDAADKRRAELLEALRAPAPERKRAA